MVRLGVLGPLLVLDEAGRQVTVAAARQRALLAILALRANQVVPSDELAELVFDGAASDAAAGTVRSYVWRLRKGLGPAWAQRITAHPPGYLCRADEDEVDVLAFEALCRRADTALRNRRWAQASQAAESAVALWRDTPLLDVPSRMLRDAFVPRLERLRAQVIEDQADAGLWLGHHELLVQPLRELAAQHPLRERLHAQLMLALAHSGRRAEALEAYREARRTLIAELGIEPGPELRALHKRILAGDEARTDAEPSGDGALAPSTATTAVVPRQLPASAGHFTGRAAELAWLTALAQGTDPQGAAGGAAVIRAVDGMAGIGKTTLVLHAAHRLVERFPDGQLYVDLHGFASDRRPVTPAEAVRGFLGALGVLPGRIPADLDAQTALYRTLIAGRRILIVLDNARDASQVRPLLPGSRTVGVLVTSRNRLTGLAAVDGAGILTLGLLTAAQARELLAARLGAARVAAEPEAVRRIVAASGRLPIALAIVAARAGANPCFALADVARELDEAGRGLDAFDGGEPAADVRAVFSWSYATLTAPAARLFRLLGLHPGPDLGTAAAASLAACTQAQVRPLLAELTRTNLINQHSPGRYALHDLLRAYAIHLVQTTEPEAQRRAGIQRCLDHYLHSAFAAERHLDKDRDPIALAPACAGVTAEEPAGYGSSLDWFTVERPVLLAVVHLAAAAGMDDHARQLSWTLWTFLDWQGHWHDHAAVARTALAAAARLTDPGAQALAHRQLARAYLRLGRLDDAHALLERALELCVGTGDRTGQANAHNNLAILWERRGEPARGLDHADRALDLFRAVGHRFGQANALNNVGWFQALLGRHRQALSSCRQALALHEALGNRYGQAGTLDSLGFIHHQLGRYTEALDSYRRALSLHRELGDRYYEGDSLARMGDTHRANGDPVAADRAYRQALSILIELDHPDADEVRSKLGFLPGAACGVPAPRVDRPGHGEDQVVFVCHDAPTIADP